MKMIKKIGIGVCGILMVYALCSMAYSAFTTSVYIEPYRINLNNMDAGMSDNDVLASLYNAGPLCNYIEDRNNAGIEFNIHDENGKDVDCGIVSVSIRKAYTHYEIKFDKTEIQTCATDNKILGEVMVTVEGTFQVSASKDGPWTPIEFSADNQIEFIEGGQGNKEHESIADISCRQ